MLLDVINLKMHFPVHQGVFRRKVALIKAVDNVSFSVKKGETLGLIGESGCGKTTVSRCIVRLYRPTSGSIFYDGSDIAGLSEATMKAFRREIQIIFQDPYASLNPRQTARSIVGEPLKTLKLAESKDEYDDRVDELFRLVGLRENMLERYPHEFSGGQRQRIAIARALACKPSFIICDEPVSALDVSIQAQVINLLKELQDELGLTYLFIAHDLSVVRHICNSVAVMYLGKIVEMADAQRLYEDPRHPYTRALLSAAPVPDPFVEEERQQIILEGEVPSPMNPPSGCRFHPRCPIAIDECARSVPQLHPVGSDHDVACIRVP